MIWQSNLHFVLLYGGVFVERERETIDMLRFLQGHCNIDLFRTQPVTQTCPRNVRDIRLLPEASDAHA